MIGRPARHRSSNTTVGPGHRIRDAAEIPYKPGPGQLGTPGVSGPSTLGMVNVGDLAAYVDTALGLGRSPVAPASPEIMFAQAEVAAPQVEDAYPPPAQVHWQGGRAPAWSFHVKPVQHRQGACAERAPPRRSGDERASAYRRPSATRVASTPADEPHESVPRPARGPKGRTL
jgi:hypothetical protein